MKKIILFFAYCLLILCTHSVSAQAIQKNRLIVLSDIEAEVDDTESFIRLLLYANQIDIKGLIATTSVWKKNSVAPESIKKLIEAYRKVQPNLLKHEADFPDAAALLQMVKGGLPLYGMLGVGKDKDSEGSDWILKVLEEKDERPLWIAVWGGSNTLAQTLYKIKQTKTPSLNRTFCKLLTQLAALNGKEAVAWVFVHDKTSWKLTSLWAVVLAEVVDGLLFAATKGDFF